MYDKEVRVGYISTILDSHGGGQLKIITLRAWQYPTTGHQFTSILFFTQSYWMPMYMYDREVRLFSTILDSDGGGQLKIIRLSVNVM